MLVLHVQSHSFEHATILYRNYLPLFLYKIFFCLPHLRYKQPFGSALDSTNENFLQYHQYIPCHTVPLLFHKSGVIFLTFAQTNNRYFKLQSYEMHLICPRPREKNSNYERYLSLVKTLFIFIIVIVSFFFCFFFCIFLFF